MRVEEDKITCAVLELFKVVSGKPDATTETMVDDFAKIKLKKPLVQVSKLQGKVPTNRHNIKESLGVCMFEGFSLG